MLECKEPESTIQRTVAVSIVIRPTPTEIADSIWSLTAQEQVTLLGCLKRRFCDKDEGLLQLAHVANTLDRTAKDKSDAAKHKADEANEAKTFVEVLSDYVLEKEE